MKFFHPAMSWCNGKNCKKLVTIPKLCKHIEKRGIDKKYRYVGIGERNEKEEKY